jgi:RNA polymerase sigma factor (sigma-70 family)
VHREDQAIITRVRQNDEAAIGQLRKWIALCASPFRARLASEWEDLLEDIFLEVLEALDGFDGDEAKLKPFICRIASRTCIDWFRKKKRRVMLNLDELLEMLESRRDSSGGETRGPASQRDANKLAEAIQINVEAQIARKEILIVCLRIMNGMTQVCRETWGMILAGENYEAASEVLGVTKEALRKRAFDCRKRLKEELEERNIHIEVTVGELFRL